MPQASEDRLGEAKHVGGSAVGFLDQSDRDTQCCLLELILQLFLKVLDAYASPIVDLWKNKKTYKVWLKLFSLSLHIGHHPLNPRRLVVVYFATGFENVVYSLFRTYMTNIIAV